MQEVLSPKRKETKKTEEINTKLAENGYQLVEMWEYDWAEFKKNHPARDNLEEQANHQTIKVRDALFGGRTEGFKTYHKCSEKEKIFYYDVVSLYPTVNSLDD